MNDEKAEALFKGLERLANEQSTQRYFPEYHALPAEEPAPPAASEPEE